MITGRVRQFFWAFFSSVSEQDRNFVKEILDSELLPLFYRMSVPDQCHSLRVARYVQSHFSDGIEPADYGLLLRCSLLHDIGRQKGDLGVFGKSFAVIFSNVFPGLSDKYSKKENGYWHRKMYIYYQHAKIGADILMELGYSEEAEVIRRHHEAPADDDPPELRFLRIADENS